MRKKQQNISQTDKSSKVKKATKQSWFKKWIPLVVLSTALMIIIIDTTVLNVSLKTIIEDLGTDITGIQWVITIYSLTLAAFTITGGRLGDLYGRKKMFIVGAIIFAIGSFITSISNSVGTMIIGESIIEGLGAALMMPATASLLMTMYQGRDRAIAFGVWGGVAGAASAMGPILGGYLTTNYSWRWAFRINLFVVAFLLLGAMLIKETKEHLKKTKLDVVGVVLSATGLLAFVFGIIETSSFGWLIATNPYKVFGFDLLPFGLSISPVAMLIGVCILIGFVFWEKKVEASGETPLVSLKILNNSQFMFGASVSALLSLGMVGLVFSLPVFLQSVHQLDALHTGLALLPMSIVVLIAAPFSGMISKFITAKRLIQTGLTFAFFGSILLHFSLSADSSIKDLAPGLMFFGLGMGFVMAQASNMTLSAVSVEEAGEASGLNNTLRQIGSSFGSAIIGAILLTSLSSNLMSGIKSSTVLPDPMKASIIKSAQENPSALEFGSNNRNSKLPPNVGNELKSIANTATANSARKSILATSVFIALAFIVASFLPNTKHFDKSTNTISTH